MASYRYQPLNPKTEEIRLMTLPPGNVSAEIIITIETTVLTQSNWPHYEALSYTWGSSDNPVPIAVQGLIKQNLDISRNLATALPYLRLPNRPRVLWIDAICIDQQNLSERSFQVKKMREIFQKAQNVIIWLGPEANNSTLALKTLDILASKIYVDWYTAAMKPICTGHSEAHWANPFEALPYDQGTWIAIYHLLLRSWFERLWVWQEVRLPTCDAVVLCGTDTLPWRHFRSAIYCLHAKVATAPDFRGLGERIEHVANLCDAPLSADLEVLITRTRFCKCSDPRDRVYAVLGMMDQSDADINIEPDYAKAVGEVYRDAALEYIKKRKILRLLGSCAARDKVSGMPKWIPDWAVPTQVQDWKMPSWVPNWSIPNPTKDLPYCHSTANGTAEMRYDGGQILEVTGVALGTVNTLDAILPPDAAHTMTEMVETMQKLAPSYFRNDPYVVGGAIGDAFLRTFCCNMFDEVYVPPSSGLPNFLQVKQVFLDLLDTRKESPTSVALILGTYLGHAHEYVLGRLLFTMQEGYIGLAPAGSKVGDHICLILGCDAPLVLRPTGNKEWLLVGRCYVHGIDDGKVFLGDLPKRYRRVVRFEEISGKWWPAFLDNETGSTLIEDPRLGPLPPGWHVKPHDFEKAWNWYTDGSGNSNRSMPDPRVTANAFRKRGINLETFKLV